MRFKAGFAVMALALLTTACAVAGHAQGRQERGERERERQHERGEQFGRDEIGQSDDDEDEGPRRPRLQLFISPAGQPFRAPMDQPYPVAAWFAQADANHDGRVTREEFRADAEAWFKVLDTNGDGQISMPEVTHWEEQLVPEITQPTIGGYGGGRGGPMKRNEIDTRVQGAATFSLINEPHPIRGADADFSMAVNRSEWRAAADRRFALLDVDGDGAIALIDLKPTPAQKLYERAAKRKDGGKPPGGPGGRRPR